MHLLAHSNAYARVEGKTDKLTYYKIDKGVKSKMIQLQNYSIRRIDVYNITYAVYKKIDTSKGRQPKDATQKRDAFKWVESQKYFGSLQACLQAIKNDILMQLVNDAPSEYAVLVLPFGRRILIPESTVKS